MTVGSVFLSYEFDPTAAAAATLSIVIATASVVAIQSVGTREPGARRD